MEEMRWVKTFFKELMKEGLRDTVTSSWEKHWQRFRKSVEDATNAVARTVLDEEKIEEIAKSAQQGAAYVAIEQRRFLMVAMESNGHSDGEY
jgi:glucosamine 6-phosphate synthetase-like amidotransferase/phosphosugar isomerase protein